MKNFSMVSQGMELREPISIRQDSGPRAARLWLLTCGLVLMVAIAVGTIISVDKFKENAIENGKEGLESAVLLLVRHFDQPKSASPIVPIS